MPVSIRPAAPKDTARIHKLALTAHINPAGLDWRRFVVIPNADDEVIACGQVKPHRDGSNELASIVVEPAWRGRGLARRIIEHLIASAEGPLYLMCRSTLGSLYEKFGFHPVQYEHMPRYFQRVSRLASIIEILQKEGETLLVMKRAEK